MKNYHLYIITNKVNDKKYVGITKMGYLERWKRHTMLTNKGSNHLTILYNAMRKYGIDNFKIDFICEGDSWKNLCDMEKSMIRQWNTYVGKDDSWGYNGTEGGDGTSGYVYTKEQLDARKKRGLTEEHKQNISKNNARYWQDKNHSDATITKIKEKRALQVCSDETREKYRRRWTGSNNPRAKAVLIDDSRFDTLASAAKFLDIHPETLSKRIKSDKHPNIKWA